MYHGDVDKQFRRRLLEFRTNASTQSFIPVEGIDHLIDMALSTKDKHWFNRLTTKKKIALERGQGYVVL